MYITNVTDDYNNTLSINNTCTNKEKNIEIIILFLQKFHAECRLYA